MRQQLPSPGARSGQKDLGDLMAARKVDESHRRVLPWQDARLYVKIPRKVEVSFDGFAF